MNDYLLDAQELFRLLKGGLNRLARNERMINELNVFPVPDGDTGTNMRITLEKGLENAKDLSSVGAFFSDVALGSLFGARGNSGVLLSQFFKGMSIYFDGKESISPTDFLLSLKSGYQKAYEAAIEPIEGTILTVARESVETTSKEVDSKIDFKTLLQKLVSNMSISLLNTPNLLPVLKEHGVIDSGGKGLLCIFEGILETLEGKEDVTTEMPNVSNEGENIKYSSFNADSVLDYGYCTEFILQLLNEKIKKQAFSLNDFISYLKGVGDSIVAFEEKNRVKVHIHTKTPSLVISKAQEYGEFISFKMENMSLQHNETLILKEEKKKERKKFAIIGVAQGKGLLKLFRDLGCDYVLDGGETMNSSVSDFLEAIEASNADTVFILPNNSNLFLSAIQASSIINSCKVEVIESQTIQEGYMALQSIIKYASKDEVKATLESAIENVDSYFVAKSSKESSPNEICHYSSGDYLGAKNHSIQSAGKTLNEATIKLIKSIPGIEDRPFLFVFYGKDVVEKDINELKAFLDEEYPLLDVGFIEGDESIYSYLIGVSK